MPTVTREEHFDADGNHTGTTVATTPSRWSEEDKAWELAYSEMLATDYCPGCGELKSIAHDPMRAWMVGFDECRRCFSLESIQRQRNDDDAKAEKAGAKTYPGARVWWIREYDWQSDPNAELEALTNGGQDSNRQVPGGSGGSDSEYRPPDEVDNRLG